MRGNNQHIVIQTRDEKLLRELVVMRLVDREQAKAVAGFQSTTRANARLLALLNAGLLRRFFQGTVAGGKKSLYTLSDKGARFIGVPHNGLRHEPNELLVANFFVAHQLSINEIYCALKFKPIPIEGARFGRWMTFTEPITRGIPLIPDAYCELATAERTLAAFLEVDLGSEGPAIWKKKIKNYQRYLDSEKFEEQFGQDRFRVLVVLNSESRLELIRKIVQGFAGKNFGFTTFEAIRKESIWASVWLRESGDTKRSLI